MAGAQVTAAARTAPPLPARDRRPIHRCRCGHALRAFGRGRHRVYFEIGDLKLDDPVMGKVCPRCGEGLPGKAAHGIAGISV